MSVDSYLQYLVDLKKGIEDGNAAIVSGKLSILKVLPEISTTADYSELAEKYPPGKLFEDGNRIQEPQHWGGLITEYFEAVHQLKQSSLQGAIEHSMEMVNELVRCARPESGWIVGPLKTVSSELRQLVFEYVKTQEYEREKEQDSDEYASSLDDKLANTLQKPFKVCVSDKTDEKKPAVYFFADELFKTYVRFGKFDAAQNLVKVLQHTVGIPSLKKVSKSDAVTYYYYVSMLDCMEGSHLGSSAEMLNKAADQCYWKSEANQRRILTLLLPLNFLVHRWLPSSELFESYPALATYKLLLHALRIGSLQLYDTELAENRRKLLQHHLYGLYLKIRPYVELQLIKATAHSWDGEKQHIVPLTQFQSAFSFSGGRPYTIEEVESRIASQIYAGNVKGYISHGNGVVVLSKTNSFPGPPQ